MRGLARFVGNESAVFFGVSLCFLLSGFAALLYQTAWMRQLAVVFGTSELAVATVLAAYMAGLAAGAAVAARLVERIRRPILVYGILEAAIAGSALAVPLLLELAAFIYTALFGGQAGPPDASGIGQSLYYLTATFLVLAIPTACMGATLPILTRYVVRSDDQVGPRVGALYALNTAGAIGGTLFAAFLLLPKLGLAATVFVGAGTNLLVFGIAVLLERTAGKRWAVTDRPVEVVKDAGWQPATWILPVMLVSGVTTFTYEVLWTRLLSHVLGGSVIAFATMLASFLSGIAIGSAVASRLATTRSVSQLAFVIAELGIAITSLVIYQLLDRLVPDTAGLLSNVTLSIALLLPAALFVGATFPLAVRILSHGEHDAAVASARVYAWNTLGAIAGAVTAGFVLLPELRFEGTIKLAVVVNVVLAIVVAVAIPPRRIGLAAASVTALLLIVPVFRPQMPEAILRVSALNDVRNGEIRFYDVGRSATVLVLERDGYFYLRSNGLSEAAIDLKGAPPSRHSQRMLAALPVIARPGAESMMVVGLGGAVFAEDAPATLTGIDIIELEPKIVTANQSIAGDRNADPLQDRRINIVINDARNALRLTNKNYDIIVSQPSHPWTAGASHLFTREFMQAVHERLTDDGVFLQWMNTRFVSEELLRSLAATLRDVYPYVRAYRVENSVLFFLASDSPISPERSFAAGDEPLPGMGEQYLRIGVGSMNDIVAGLAWDTEGIRKLAGDAPVITDNNNLMATRSAAAFESGALSFSRLKELLIEYGPLFDPESDIHLELAEAIDFVYVADRLKRSYAGELTAALADALTANSDPRALVIAARYLAGAQRTQREDQLLLAALDRNPTDSQAAYLLLSKRDDAVLQDTLPERIKGYVSNLTPSASAVIVSWGEAQRGNSLLARGLESDLATAQPSDPWYLEAAKLRANWRINATREGESGAFAHEALDIIDNAIAVYQDLDFYGMRMGAAFLAEEHDAVVETARRMVSMIRSDLEFRQRYLHNAMAPAELITEARRIQSVRAGLAAIREKGRVPAYKLDDLDEQIERVLNTLRELNEKNATNE